MAHRRARLTVFGRQLLLSKDLDASRTFYRDVLGLEIAREDKDDRIVIRSGGGTRRSVRSRKHPGAPGRPNALGGQIGSGPSSTCSGRSWRRSQARRTGDVSLSVSRIIASSIAAFVAL